MALFAKREQVYGPEQVSVGDFDITVDGCYRNVVPIPIDLKPHRKLYVKIDSAHPVDVVVAREDHSSAAHKEGVTHVLLGPFDTGRASSMGVFLGVDKGEKVLVTVEAWTDRERSPWTYPISPTLCSEGASSSSQPSQAWCSPSSSTMRRIWARVRPSRCSPCRC